MCATACHIEFDQKSQRWSLSCTSVHDVQAQDNLRGRQAHAGRRVEGTSLADVEARMKDRVAMAWQRRPPPGQLLMPGTLLAVGFWLVCKFLRPLSLLLSLVSLVVITLVVTQSAGHNALVDILSDLQFKPSYREIKHFVEMTTWTVLAAWVVLVLLAHIF